MAQSNPSAIKTLLKISNPVSLLGGFLFYALGAGIAKYLGENLNWDTYLLGQVCVTMLQLSSSFLKVTYELPPDQQKNLVTQNPEYPGITRLSVILLSYTFLTIVAVFTVLLFTGGMMNGAAFFVLGVGFLLAFFYGVPPIRLIYNGYGELSQAILLSNLTPAFAFLLQHQFFHRLLGFITFPLTLFFLAMSLALSLERYAGDERMGRKGLMVRLGWQKGTVIHNILILSAYGLIAGSALIGLPWSLSWPGLLSLPIGLFQIWQINRIISGAKPRWKLLAFIAITTVGVTTYLIAYALWTQ
jgi:1,4-dihydroxy-2-naphthoate octaprenyltransferase